MFHPDIIEPEGLIHSNVHHVVGAVGYVLATVELTNCRGGGNTIKGSLSAG